MLIDLLKDPEPSVRMYAAETLGALGPRAAPAIPVLTVALADDEVGGFGVTVGERAAEGLKRIREEEGDAGR